VDASGNVAIGTTNTGYGILGVYEASNSLFSVANSTSYGQFQQNGSDLYVNYNLGGAAGGNLVFRSGAGSTERMRLTSAGLLGLGTSTPSSLLEVASGADAILTLTGNVAGGNVAAVDFKRNGGTVNASIRSESAVANDAGEIYFSTRPVSGSLTERVRIDREGRVGIGTTSPSALLELSGTGTVFKANTATTTSTAISLQLGGLVTSSNSGCFIKSHVNLGSTLNSQLSFEVNGGALEAARLDSSGRLLIGTSSARTSASHTGSLQLEGTTFSASTFSIISNTNDSSGSYIHLGKARGASIGSTTVVADGDTLGQIHFTGADGTNLINGAIIAANVDGTPGANDLPTRLVFSTTADGAATPTERMRITQGGAGQFFCSSDTDPINAATAAAAGTSRWLYLGYYGATTVNTGTQSFGVYSNGNVINTNNSYGAISDLKLKENIVDANSQWDDLKALQVRNYNFKEGQTHTQIGLVAQEAELVSPGLVFESPDRDDEGNDLGTVTKSVNYSVLYMKAVKALQEAMERIEQLETKVAALEGA
jgi:hypothetical protein